MIRGVQIAYEFNGQLMLGDVVDRYLAPDGPDYARLCVRHFNGEPWPFDPYERDVTFLERTYEETPE